MQEEERISVAEWGCTSKNTIEEGLHNEVTPILIIDLSLSVLKSLKDPPYKEGLAANVFSSIWHGAGRRHVHEPLWTELVSCSFLTVQLIFVPLICKTWKLDPVLYLWPFSCHFST